MTKLKYGYSRVFIAVTKNTTGFMSLQAHLLWHLLTCFTKFKVLSLAVPLAQAAFLSLTHSCLYSIFSSQTWGDICTTTGKRSERVAEMKHEGYVVCHGAESVLERAGRRALASQGRSLWGRDRHWASLQVEVGPKEAALSSLTQDIFVSSSQYSWILENWLFLFFKCSL